MGALESKRVWEQSDNGNWIQVQALSSGSSPDYLISHDKDKGSYMYRVAIPVNDLPE